MSILQVVAGVVVLFLGRELSFIFSAAIAALIGVRLIPMLPDGWPAWADLAFLIGFAVLAGILTALNEQAGFYICGFLFGGYVSLEFFAPNSLTFPFLLFIIGSTLGAVLVGVFTDWAMILVSCLIGTYLIYNALPVTGMTRTLAAGGIFAIGAIAQVILFQSQKHSDRR